jgi:hypothetical protein
MMDNESILLGIWPAIRNVDQEVIFSYIFLSDNARPCIHTPYAFCYLSRPVIFFLCFASGICGLYPILGESHPNVMVFLLAWLWLTTYCQTAYNLSRLPRAQKIESIIQLCCIDNLLFAKKNVHYFGKREHPRH